jgi:predicted PolB exonuclease-like 3'-5' exonuclease
MLYRIFDIEAVVDPEMGPAVTRDGEPIQFPAPPWWRVVAIASILIASDEHTESGDWELRRSDVVVGPSEAMLVRLFAESQARRRATLVGFNSRHFDMPVIVARAMKCGVSFPWYWEERDARYRFSETGHIDLMDALTDYGAADRTGLDAWARLVGAPPKGGKGSDVAGMIERGEWTDVGAYCFGDVVTLACVFFRWMMVKGRMRASTEIRLSDAVKDAVPNMVELDERYK